MLDKGQSFCEFFVIGRQIRNKLSEHYIEQRDQVRLLPVF